MATHADPDLVGTRWTLVRCEDPEYLGHQIHLRGIVTKPAHFTGKGKRREPLRMYDTGGGRFIRHDDMSVYERATPEP